MFKWTVLPKSYKLYGVKYRKIVNTFVIVLIALFIFLIQVLILFQILRKKTL